MEKRRRSVCRIAKTYACSFCNKITKNKAHLSAHMVSHTQEKPYKCSKCDKCYSSPHGLSHHFNAIHKKMKFNCPEPGCDQVFTLPASVLQHRIAVHNKKPDLKAFVECSVCKTMVKKLYIKQHMFRHNIKNRKYKCLTCEKAFFQPSELKTHEKIHLSAPLPGSRNCTKPKIYKCSECDKSYVSINGLNSHVTAIHKKIKYMCPVPDCGKSLVSPSVLKRHLLTHDPAKNNPLVPCSICNKKVKKLTLNQHVRRHDKQKQNFKCDVCGKSFFSAWEVESHENTHRSQHERQLFPCSLCDFKSQNIRYINSHVRKIHSLNPKTYDCTFCSKKFASLVSLEVHLRSHTGEKPFPCEQCGQGFMTQQTLNNHVQRVHINRDKNYKCPNCPREFLLKSALSCHMHVHNENVKKFVCTLCMKVFKKKYKMKKHAQMHGEENQFNSTNFSTIFKLQNSNSTSQLTIDTGTLSNSNVEDDFKCNISAFKDSQTLNIKNSYSLNFSAKEIGLANENEGLIQQQISSKSHLLSSKNIISTSARSQLGRTHQKFQEERGESESQKPTKFVVVGNSCKRSVDQNTFLTQHLTKYHVEDLLNCKPCFVLVKKLKLQESTK